MKQAVYKDGSVWVRHSVTVTIFSIFLLKLVYPRKYHGSCKFCSFPKPWLGFSKSLGGPKPWVGFSKTLGRVFVCLTPVVRVVRGLKILSNFRILVPLVWGKKTGGRGRFFCLKFKIFSMAWKIFFVKIIFLYSTLMGIACSLRACSNDKKL